MRRWAVRFELAVSRSSWARDSVSDLTAALVALYDGFPLRGRKRQDSRPRSYRSPLTGGW